MNRAAASMHAVRVLESREQLGLVAAEEIADAIRDRVARAGNARVVFAAAPSQAETLSHLIESRGVDWSRVDAFHMDEYVGLEDGAPQGFAAWLRRHLFDRLPFRSVNVIDPGEDAHAEAVRYGRLISDAPIDVVVLGVGVNGHIAFNDPANADFADQLTAKVVDLDRDCRQQQVDDECFDRIENVPLSAITLTVPTLLSGHKLFCVVPGGRKAEAVRATVEAPISTEWPSTILRTHPQCRLYLEPASAAALVKAW